MKSLIIFIAALGFLSCQKTKRDIEIGQTSDSGRNGNIEVHTIIIDSIKINEIEDKEKDFTFGGVYPKLRGLQNKEFEEELNKTIFNNVNRCLATYYEGKDGGGFELEMYFGILTLNDSIISIVQEVRGGFAGFATSCGIVLNAYTVNSDIQKNQLLTPGDFNMSNVSTDDFNRKVLGYFEKIIDYSDIDIDYIPQAKNTEQQLNYNYALKNDSLFLVEFAMPAACVSKQIYMIPLKLLSDNKINNSISHKQPLGSSSDASNLVKSWIESLGKRDFQAAYNLMTPSLSKGYDAFTSTSRYGGITKTLLHSSETVSSSGCNYIVEASYDSYDPYNRDGKFTERFNVNNCSGNWQITNIKNINTEYYR